MSSRRGDLPPAGIRRQLRQEAGFGCCRCGFPFIQYHHIVPWHVEPHFRPADMMAVCPNCHDEITNGKVSESEQRGWKENPFNIQENNAYGMLRVDQSELVVALAGGTFTEIPVLIEINGESIISARKSEAGVLLLSVRSYSSNGDLLLDIVDNDWQTGAELPWDLEAKWRYVKLRYKSGGIALEVDARSVPVSIKGTFWKDGLFFKVTENYIEDQRGNKIQGSNMEYCRVGICCRIKRLNFYSYSGAAFGRFSSLS